MFGPGYMVVYVLVYVGSSFALIGFLNVIRIVGEDMELFVTNVVVANKSRKI